MEHSSVSSGAISLLRSSSTPNPPWKAYTYLARDAKFPILEAIEI